MEAMDKENDAPKLLLKGFSEPPWLEFNNVRVGNAITKQIQLVNSTAVSIGVSVDKTPIKKGFSVPLDQKTIEVPPFGSLPLNVAWAPVAVGKVRETLTLLLDKKIRLSVRLSGNATEGKKQPLTPSSKSVISRSTEATALNRSTISRSTESTALNRSTISRISTIKKRPAPKLPAPPAEPKSASERQDEAFTRWINDILTHPDLVLFGASQQAGFGGVNLRRRELRARVLAQRLYNSEEVVGRMDTLDDAIREQRLAVRADIDMLNDVGVRQQVLELLLCYQPAWLRLALETIFSENIRVDNKDAMLPALSKFLMKRILWDDETAQAHMIQQKPALYDDGFTLALHQHTLRQVLMIILLLDRAASAQILPMTLFTKV